MKINKSPLNYVGGKYKLLPQLLPIFPNNINTFVDLFCGGLDITLNVNAKKYVANDKLSHIIDLYTNLSKCQPQDAHNKILQNIEKYELSKENKDGYLKLRNDYNENKTWDKFYTLVCYSFNNNIRFNKKDGFNVAFGANRSSYNSALQERFQEFIEIIQNKKIFFTNKDFRDLKIDKLTENDFVYLDPPYFITTANYNENGGWGKQDEIDLYNLLDKLNNKNIKFGLSNVVKNQNGVNDILSNFMKKYKVIDISANYSNCNYQKKDKTEKVREVYVCNY